MRGADLGSQGIRTNRRELRTGHFRLVPKLCLGTRVSKLRFDEFVFRLDLQNRQCSKQSFGKRRPQAELGNEEYRICQQKTQQTNQTRPGHSIWTSSES